MSDLAARLAAGFRDARSRLDKDAANAKCPTLCDDDCDGGCHECHQPWSKKLHGEASCPSTTVLAGVAVARRQLDALEWIAELHHDDRGYCWNCDHSDWPCPTFDLVAAGLGIDL
jgi:hypothetical protein